MGLVLSVTLFIYVSKLNFTYDKKNVPWSRKIPFLPVGFVLQNRQEKISDCKKHHIVCHGNSDCEVCGSDFKCVNQQCIKPFDKVTVSCDHKKGGIATRNVFGEEVCYCSVPQFYVGEDCSEVNPDLEKIAFIDPDFDARTHTPGTEYITCLDENLSPVKWGHSFGCVGKSIIRYRDTL